jgi:hypothetical protein
MSTINEKEATDKEGSTNKAESPSVLVDPAAYLENFWHLTEMMTWSDDPNSSPSELTDHGLFEDPADARVIARTALERWVGECEGLRLRNKSKFTMEQYLSGVLGPEKDIRCDDGLWSFDERLEKDGSRTIEFNEVECDGERAGYQFRIKKYKVPKITKKIKATPKVPLAKTPTGLAASKSTKKR